MRPVAWSTELGMDADWVSSGGNPGHPVRPTALAEPDLERYPIRLPAQVIYSGLG